MGNKQHLTDLITLFGWVHEREGFEHFALPVALAARSLFPTATLSQTMQKMIDDA